MWCFVSAHREISCCNQARQGGVSENHTNHRVLALASARCQQLRFTTLGRSRAQAHLSDFAGSREATRLLATPGLKWAWSPKSRGAGSFGIN